jgi:DNA polymerase-1
MKLLVIDGNSIMNRAFYGIKLLTTKDGRYTNAVYGFLNIFLRQLADSGADRVAVVFDLPGGTFRNRMYGGYKANRRGMPEELAQQMPVIKELLGYLGYAVVTCPDYEADDVLGTLSRAASEQGAECCILSGDRDSLQLVGNGTYVAYPSVRMGRTETEHMDEAAVFAKYGVTPSQFIDVKALMGDSSDNVPGVSGIGEKTATALIAEYGSLDGVYENLDGKLIKPAMRRHLEEDKQTAYLSRDLVTIDRHAPVNEDLDAYRIGQRDEAAAAALLNGLEMHSLVDKLGLTGAPAPAPRKEEEASPVPEAVLTDPEGLPEGDVSILVRDGKYCALAGGRACELDGERAADLLCGNRRVVTNAAKPLYRLCLSQGRECGNVAFDIEIGAYLLNPSAADYEPGHLAAEYGVRPDFVTEPAELGLLAPLERTLRGRIGELGMTFLLEEVEMPLARVLASMEHEGFLVDLEGISEFGREVSRLADREQQLVWAEAGHEFNLNSPKQLGTVLFEELDLPSGKKTKTGYSTNAEVLERLRLYHPIVDHLLNYRTYTKLLSTYVEGLTKAADGEGRIHTEFRQTETRTGRISSVNPNLQNIPIRTELGSNMRRFFVAGKGNLLLDADYSQIELRVLASVSGDENMIRAFREGHDVHTETASSIFRVPRELVTPELRRRAKAVNFGIVYGIGAYSLSQDVRVSVKEAQQYIDD